MDNFITFDHYFGLKNSGCLHETVFRMKRELSKAVMRVFSQIGNSTSHVGHLEIV